MNRQIALAYIAAVMAGILGAVCIPARWYQSPAPKIAAVHPHAGSQAALLADKR